MCTITKRIFLFYLFCIIDVILFYNPGQKYVSLICAKVDAPYILERKEYIASGFAAYIFSMWYLDEEVWWCRVQVLCVHFTTKLLHEVAISMPHTLPMLTIMECICKQQSLIPCKHRLTLFADILASSWFS